MDHSNLFSLLCGSSYSNVGLKLNIQKTKIMVSSPIPSLQINEETMETVRDYFLGSKVTADGDCSHESKRCFLKEKL